jgi:hypothetical protein
VLKTGGFNPAKKKQKAINTFLFPTWYISGQAI